MLKTMLIYISRKKKYSSSSGSGGGGGGGGGGGSSSSSIKSLCLHDRKILQYCKSLLIINKTRLIVILS